MASMPGLCLREEARGSEDMPGPHKNSFHLKLVLTNWDILPSGGKAISLSF